MSKNKLVFEKNNYQILLAGLAVLVLGFIVMMLDKEPHGFGFMGLTAGPIIIFLSFIIQFFAIFYKSGKKE